MADKIFLLKGGRIYDGTASEPFVGDILFQGDRILEVVPHVDTTPHVEADNVQVIDIAGLSVSSGFFDAHSHNDWFSIKDRGYVKPGYHADFTVFNEDLLKNGTPDCNKAFGIEKVFINGRCVLDADKLDCEALKTTGQAMRSV